MTVHEGPIQVEDSVPSDTMAAPGRVGLEDVGVRRRGSGRQELVIKLGDEGQLLVSRIDLDILARLPEASGLPRHRGARPQALA